MIAGFGQPVIDLYKSFGGKFEVLGVILDYNRKKKFPFFYEFLSAHNLAICDFDEIGRLQPELIICVNYNKIIDVANINIPFLVNIHMGLLPMYRGNSANAWSILNGDRNVGYTLHEINEVLDGGKIYYKFKYEIKDKNTYTDAKNAINDDLIKNIPLVIRDILNGKLKGIEQESEEFVYACRLIPEDGILKSWNLKTEEIVNRNIIFSRPLGTGLKFINGNNIVEISKLSKVSNYKNSSGIAGAIVMKTINGSVWVKTSDNVISIDEIIIDERNVKPADIFKIGDRL